MPFVVPHVATYHIIDRSFTEMDTWSLCLALTKKLSYTYMLSFLVQLSRVGLCRVRTEVSASLSPPATRVAVGKAQPEVTVKQVYVSSFKCLPHLLTVSLF